jgi:hypothetical protein
LNIGYSGKMMLYTWSLREYHVSRRPHAKWREFCYW